MILLEMFYFLLLGHFLTDFALQSSEMGKGKNRNRVPENVPPGQKIAVVWPFWLTAHAGVNALAVQIITETWWLSLGELVAHWLIDFMKCDNKLTVYQDQALHVLSKLVWASLFVFIVLE